MKKSQSKSGESSSTPIDEGIDIPGDWRGKLLTRLRALIMEANPEMTEERKWRKPSNPAGVPTWSHNGLICTGETYKNVVKMTFARGASLADPSGLFNSGLEGNTRRAIDFRVGDELDEEALKALIRAAVALNTTSARGESSRQVCETLSASTDRMAARSARLRAAIEVAERRGVPTRLGAKKGSPRAA
jgi:hypothetical protein